MNKGRKAAFAVIGGLLACLAIEAALPAAGQPTAQAGVALIRAYQSAGSPVLKSCGVQCRYTPSCSHYAVDALSSFGTLQGGFKTAGRILRCAPWGGGGYDPAVRSVQQVTPEERKEQEEAARQAREAAEQFKKEMEKFGQTSGKEAAEGCLACGVVGAIWLGVMAVGLGIWIFMMVFVYKDAKARGDQNAVLWLVLVVFVQWIGFIVYLIARPKGDLTPCANCKQKRLSILVKCPHCGADSGPAAIA